MGEQESHLPTRAIPRVRCTSSFPTCVNQVFGCSVDSKVQFIRKCYVQVLQQHRRGCWCIRLQLCFVFFKAQIKSFSALIHDTCTCKPSPALVSTIREAISVQRACENRAALHKLGSNEHVDVIKLWEK